MTSTKEKGQDGEEMAIAHLLKKNYSIKEQNWRFAKYEVDIIAVKDETIVFIEVKLRSSEYFGAPEIFVSTKQKLNLIRAANRYIDQNKIQWEARFDIISIVISTQGSRLKHIEDAFKPEVNQE